MLVLFILRAVLVRLPRTVQAVRNALGFSRIEKKQDWVERECDAHQGGIAAFYNPTRVGAAERDDVTASSCRRTRDRYLPRLPGDGVQVEHCSATTLGQPARQR